MPLNGPDLEIANFKLIYKIVDKSCRLNRLGMDWIIISNYYIIC